MKKVTESWMYAYAMFGVPVNNRELSVEKKKGKLRDTRYDDAL